MSTDKDKEAALVNRALGEFRVHTNAPHASIYAYLMERGGNSAKVFGDVDRAASPRPLTAPKPDPNVIDGLTRAQCLARWEGFQRGDFSDWLTPKQRAAAREEWSKALASKQAEARDRDRRQVTCQSQYDLDE